MTLPDKPGNNLPDALTQTRGSAQESGGPLGLARRRLDGAQPLQRLGDLPAITVLQGADQAVAVVVAGLLVTALVHGEVSKKRRTEGRTPVVPARVLQREGLLG